MNRNQKRIYCFIYDDAKQFYRANQHFNGSWNVTHSGDMYPIKHLPKNIKDCPVEFATNRRYFSMNRSINYPLEFILDGAAILNYKYLTGKGPNENLYFAMFEWDSIATKYKLTYNGRFDFQQKDRDEKLATFTIPVIDDSAWGILSQNDDVEFAIDCSQTNPKVIKVLIDEFELDNRYTFQTVLAPIVDNSANEYNTIPFVLVNQDGDSAGLIVKGQSFQAFPTLQSLRESNSWFMSTLYQVNNVEISGTLIFNANTTQQPFHLGFHVFFHSNLGNNYPIIDVPQGTQIIAGQQFKKDFTININLAPGENLFLSDTQGGAAQSPMSFTPVITNVFIKTKTTIESTILYGMRPLDLLKEIVTKATLERYTMDSNFFTVNNKTVLISGESVRGIKNAKIYTSFRDFFESFSALFFMALRVSNGSLFMELADEVYNRNNNIIDLGELSELKTTPAIDYFVNEVQVGSPKQDYRHPSARLEFNAPVKFSLPFTNIKNKLDLVSKYRTDFYGLIFMLLDYKGSSTVDNLGDKNVWIVDITDEIGSSQEQVETFENITINNTPLAPIIKYPLDGEIINNLRPRLKGVGVPGSTVNIYVDGVLDGGTVVGADYKWQYDIANDLVSFVDGVFDGVHVISATNTNMLGALDEIQLIIDTTAVTDTAIIYPRSGDNLYNNLPLIKGTAPAGTNINILLNGVLLAAVVADGSCKFEYKVTVPITNAAHTLDIGTGVISFNVNSFVDLPLITFIEDELDGFIIVNNLPLIKGVAKPGTIVEVWLNYVTYSKLGTAVADSNGNWELQVIPTQYIDPISNLLTDLAPIRNGLSVVSTLLINNFVNISISGFKLNRPAYSSITGVPNNTVANTRLSPMRAMLNHKSLFASMMNMQKNDLISFQKHDKNSNLRTVLGTEVVTERSDIQYNQLGEPIAILEYANARCVARHKFAEILYNFNSGGTVKATFRGKDIFMLPIGTMKMKSILDDVQDWKLLISPQTTYSQLLDLYKNGLTINLMNNAIYHSDYNSLHMVTYNYAQPNNINFPSIYDDWFTSRNAQWRENPQYIQKYQRDEAFKDQIITRGVESVSLRMYRCKDASLVTTFPYNAVNPVPLAGPEVVQETDLIDLNNYPPGQYFFVMCVGETLVAISERIETRNKWHNTILINSRHSVNQPGVFFSTGFKTVIRVEGLVQKLKGHLDVVSSRDMDGDTSVLYGNWIKSRLIRFGTARGLPDYLYLKCVSALSNDELIIENEQMSIEDGEKVKISEDVEGVPMYYYEVVMNYKENTKGKVFPVDGGSDIQGVVLVVDASAIGLPPNSLINIEEG